MGWQAASGFVIAVEDRRCFIRRTSDGALVASVEPIEAALLGMAGRAAVHSQWGSRGSTALDHLLFRLRALIVETDRPDTCWPDVETLRGHIPGAMRPLPAPRILHWSVTEVCPRRCVYCFANPRHGSRASDSTLQRDRLQTLFAEARALGTEGVLLSGSEPLLRPDLPEIIGDARRLGLEVLLTTKHPISANLAHRLRDAALPSIALSVDTLDADISASLIGSSSYPEQVRSTVANLRNAGVGFSIQAVLTPQTAAHFDALLCFASKNEAAAIQLVPFEPVMSPIAPFDQDELHVAREVADDIVAKAQADFPGLRVTLFDKAAEGECSGVHCDIGATKLFFTPSGRVHRCYKLTHDHSLNGPSLTEVGIAEAWHGRAFGATLLPSRDDYAGSACGTCGNFGSCNRSGRCIFEAKSRFGRYAAPDRPCASTMAE